MKVGVVSMKIGNRLRCAIALRINYKRQICRYYLEEQGEKARLDPMFQIHYAVLKELVNLMHENENEMDWIGYKDEAPLFASF